MSVHAQRRHPRPAGPQPTLLSEDREAGGFPEPETPTPWPADRRGRNVPYIPSPIRRSRDGRSASPLFSPFCWPKCKPRDDFCAGSWLVVRGCCRENTATGLSGSSLDIAGCPATGCGGANLCARRDAGLVKLPAASPGRRLAGNLRGRQWTESSCIMPPGMRLPAGCEGGAGRGRALVVSRGYRAGGCGAVAGPDKPCAGADKSEPPPPDRPATRFSPANGAAEQRQ